MTLDQVLSELADLVATRVAERLTAQLPAEAPAADRWLTATQVAALLGTSPRWAYDHADQLGARRLSRRCLRFSEAAVRRYLDRRR